MFVAEALGWEAEGVLKEAADIAVVSAGVGKNVLDLSSCFLVAWYVRLLD